jgi:hypothetical protein
LSAPHPGKGLRPLHPWFMSGAQGMNDPMELNATPSCQKPIMPVY